MHGDISVDGGGHCEYSYTLDVTGPVGGLSPFEPEVMSRNVRSKKTSSTCGQIRG